MGKLIQLLAICVLWPMTIAAQSAENFNPSLITPAKGTAESKEEKAAAEAGPIPQIPSRYAGAEIESYIASVSAVFSIRSRPTDPFGQAQDPTAKPPKPKVTQGTIARPTVIPSIKFSEVIAKITVTTIIPGEGRFLIKDRSFRKGDRFPIRYGPKSYQTEIVEVSARNILFRNIENGETGNLTLDVMPSGMIKGSQGIMAPGMRPARGDAPLEIETDSDPLNSASIRNP